MKRVVVPVLALYLLAALIGRVSEQQGRSVCGCSPECWCKRPVLSVFRWVFPFGHRGSSADDKAALDHAQTN